ncbi:MAG: hypothetical protein RIR89_576 [Actinomycetota bacterium]
MAFFIGIGLAVVAAVFGTIFHQSYLAGIPLGLVLSLAEVALLAIEARESWPKRLGFLFSFGAIVFLAAQDFSGDKMIPANEIGTIWSYGAVGLAILITMWPKLKR